MKQHDLIVIGGGPGGYVAAIRARQLGMDAACIEREPRLGGTCLRVGCIPSKALLESSELYHEARESLGAHGVRVAEVTLNLEAMLARKDRVVGTLANGIDALFRKHQVVRYQGHGRIAGPGRVVVEAENEPPLELGAKHIIIATGSKPASLQGIIPDGDRIGTSTEALAYPRVPEHLVVIGGGYIGMELGSVWRRLGSKVTVLEYLDRILPGTDAEIAHDALGLFRKQGIEFRLGSKVTAARAENDACRVEVERSEPITCDRVLMAVGRVSYTEGVGLETVGIQADRHGRISVDSAFKTSVAGVYAIGDCIPGPMLAHKAEEDGVACVELIAGGFGHVDYNLVPAVIFTAPEIAAVGKTEEQLVTEGRAFKKGLFPFAANGRARALGHIAGKVKLFADKQTDRVLGVHILGPRAGDMIAEAAAAMAFGASSEDIARTSHAHPTLAEALKEAALAADGRALHA